MEMVLRRLPWKCRCVHVTGFVLVGLHLLSSLSTMVPSRQRCFETASAMLGYDITGADLKPNPRCARYDTTVSTHSDPVDHTDKSHQEVSAICCMACRGYHSTSKLASTAATTCTSRHDLALRGGSGMDKSGPGAGIHRRIATSIRWHDIKRLASSDDQCRSL